MSMLGALLEYIHTHFANNLNDMYVYLKPQITAFLLKLA